MRVPAWITVTAGARAWAKVRAESRASAMTARFFFTSAPVDALRWWNSRIYHDARVGCFENGRRRSELLPSEARIEPVIGKAEGVPLIGVRVAKSAARAGGPRYSRLGGQ